MDLHVCNSNGASSFSMKFFSVTLLLLSFVVSSIILRPPYRRGKNNWKIGLPMPRAGNREEIVKGECIINNW